MVPVNGLKYTLVQVHCWVTGGIEADEEGIGLLQPDRRGKERGKN